MPPKIQSNIKEIEHDSTKKNDHLKDLTKYSSLESLISTIPKNQPSDPINHIWQDKLKIAQCQVSSLINAIDLRGKIKQENIYRINQDICNIHTQQFALQNSSPFGKYSITPDQSGLEKSVVNLEREKRSEIVGCWKDILMTRKDLIDAISDYLSLKRKMDLLGIQTRDNQNG